jgi:hypothetical protein
MKRTLRQLALPLGVVLTAMLGVAPPASAVEREPSCVSQSVGAERQVYGPAWGKEVVAFLATHPEALEEFGFASLGDLTSFAAAQDRSACPEL